MVTSEVTQTSGTAEQDSALRLACPFKGALQKTLDAVKDAMTTGISWSIYTTTNYAPCGPEHQVTGLSFYSASSKIALPGEQRF